MNNGDGYESRLWEVLTKERLVDLSQFHRDGLFDEVPLYSRESDVNFLSHEPRSRVDQILIDFALKFLKAVISYEEHRSPYFAAITVWPAAEGDRLVPQIFVWSGPVRELRKKLVLATPKSPFAKRIQQIVRGKHAKNGFAVLEDTATDSDETRVFISLARPPYHRFIPLSGFVKATARAK
jgi:hypothetical protein